MHDKRTSPRIPVHLEAQIGIEGKNLPATILNLSLDGAFIRASQLFESHDKVMLSFALPGSKIETQVTIMWGGSIEGVSRTTFGMGVHFDQLNATERDTVASYLRNVIKS